MAWKRHKIHVESRPPDTDWQNKLSHWLHLADIALHREQPSTQASRRAGTRALEEHERLNDEVGKAVEESQSRAIFKRAS